MRPARLRDGSFVWIDLTMTRAVHALASLKNPKRLLLNRNKLALRRCFSRLRDPQSLSARHQSTAAIFAESAE
jgi:hypothetical protein